MSFNHYARKVRNPNLNIGIRYSALGSCILRFCWLTKKRYTITRTRFFEQCGLDESDIFTAQQLLDLLNAVEIERNKKLEQIRNFERKRIREKMRGKRYPSRKDVEALYD